jgi:hypothetical protein
MAATIFPFSPSQTSLFQFQPTLDGATYEITIPWLLFGKRFYASVSALNGTQIWFGAVVGSPPAFALSSLSWATGKVTVTTALPHGLKPTSTVSLNISGNTPDAYNLLAECFITGPSTFTYALANDPGDASVIGQASRDIDMLGGVVNEAGVAFTNRLVFRTSSGSFEVW